MSNIYDVIEKKNAQSFVPEADFDAASWSEKKQAERAETYARIDSACELVNTDADVLSSYLGVMAQFPNHSVSNTLLVFDQRPDATRIGDSAYWLKQGASIKKGERGITILEPGNEYTRDDGSIGTFYNNKKVFDVTQTTAKMRKSRYYDAREVLSAMVWKSPITIDVAEGEAKSPAEYVPSENKITVAQGLETNEFFFALATELSHASFSRGNENYDRSANHQTAQLSALVLAKRYSIEAPSGEIQTLNLKDATPQEIRAKFSQIRDASKEISGRIHEVIDKPKARENAMER